MFEALRQCNSGRYASGERAREDIEDTGTGGHRKQSRGGEKE